VGDIFDSTGFVNGSFAENSRETHTHRCFPVLLIFFFFVFPATAFQQNLNDTTIRLQAVEVKADRLFRLEVAGMKQRRLDSIALSDKRNMSLSDLLSENTPIFIKNYGRGALATASFRGTAASHTKVNWNGIDITSPMTGMVDFSLIPVYIIDDVVLKFGAASMEEQNGGLGGAVSLSNNFNTQQDFLAEYIQGLGSFHTYEEYLRLGFRKGNFCSQTRVYHNYSKNDFTFINRGIATIDTLTGEITNPIDTNNRAEYKIYGLMQEFYLNSGRNGYFSLKYWLQKANRAIPRVTSYEGPDNSNLNNQIQTSHYLVADWKKQLNATFVTFHTAYARTTLHFGQKNFVQGLGEVPVVFSESIMNSLMNSLAVRKKTNRGLLINARISINHHNVATNDSVLKTGYQEKRTEASAMVSASKCFFNRLNLKLLLRQDLEATHYSPLLPYLGFDFRITGKSELFLNGNIALNYHYPSLNDLFWQPGGNPDLKPEKGMGYELGLDFKSISDNIKFTGAITGFYSNINNWIIWLPSVKGYWQPENINTVISKGLEVEIGLKGSFRKIAYHLAANYSYTHTVNRGSIDIWGMENYNSQLAYVPLHSGNILVLLNIEKIGLGYQFNSYSKRYTTSGEDPQSRNYIYPYFMNDISLSRDFHIGRLDIAIRMKIYNIFNETYHSVLYRPMPGRNYMLYIMLKI